METELSCRETSREKGNEPEILPPPFPPPPMETDKRDVEYGSDADSEGGESEVSKDEGPVGDAETAQGENSGDGAPENMDGGNSDVEGSLHGSVTRQGRDNISGQQITPPSPPSPPPAARKIRITEGTSSRFFIPQPPRNAEFSPARERSEGWAPN